jgi:hypothetical protein
LVQQDKDVVDLDVEIIAEKEMDLKSKEEDNN